MNSDMWTKKKNPWMQREKFIKPACPRRASRLFLAYILLMNKTNGTPDKIAK